MNPDAGITWIRDPIQDIVGLSGSVPEGCPTILCITYCLVFRECAYKCDFLCGEYAFPK